MRKKSKTQKAIELVIKLRELDLIKPIPDPIKQGDNWIYTITFK